VARRSRTRSGRSALALTLALVALLGALGALAWFVTRTQPALESAGTGAPSAEQRDEREAALPTDASSTAQREHARAAEAKQPLGPPPIVMGVLKIRALDEGTREPIADLSFVVVRKRGGETILAHGKTAADGRARIPDLEEDTLCVRTERAPPHAPASATVAVVAGNDDEHEILVGSGGSVVGRVVDDRKLPVAGAALYLLLPDALLDPAEALAKSGADGRFRIECAAGDSGDTAWNPVPILAVLDNMRASTQALPRTGEDVDVGDMELARAARFLGRVVDPDDRPVAGALVSLRQGRLYARAHKPASASEEKLSRGPADAGFELLSGETLTDTGGRFELEAAGSGTSVVVWTSNGALQSFHLPKADPGTKKDEIVLKLEPRMSISLSLVDASGAQLAVPAPGITSNGLWAPWGAAGVFGEGRVSVLARAGGATVAWDSIGVHGADGKWRLQLKTDPARIDEISISASGYLPKLEHPPSGFKAQVELECVLEALPALHVKLVPEDRTAKLLLAPGEALQLHVCMAEPQRHGDAALGFCCGNGVFWKGTWRGEVLSLVLPVKRKAAFFVYARARGNDGEFHDVEHYGPFEPGADEHELVLDPARLSQGGGVGTRGERFAPGAGEPSARILARLEDAHTGEPIPFASLLLDEIVAAPRKPRVQRIDANEKGLIWPAYVRPGRWSLRAVAHGYRTTQVAERDVAAGDMLSFDSIQLEPLEMHAGRLLEAAGTPTQKAWLVVLDPTSTAAEIDVTRMSECTSDGYFAFFGDLPAKFVLHVEREPSIFGEPKEAQRFALAAWPASEVHEVRFAPSRRIVLLLNGTSPSEVPLSVCACPAPDEPTGLCNHQQPIVGAHLPLATSVPLASLAGAQRCALRLAPGRYQLYGENLLHVLPVMELSVTDGPGDLELTLGLR